MNRDVNFYFLSNIAMLINKESFKEKNAGKKLWAASIASFKKCQINGMCFESCPFSSAPPLPNGYHFCNP